MRPHSSRSGSRGSRRHRRRPAHPRVSRRRCCRRRHHTTSRRPRRPRSQCHRHGRRRYPSTSRRPRLRALFIYLACVCARARTHTHARACVDTCARGATQSRHPSRAPSRAQVRACVRLCRCACARVWLPPPRHCCTGLGSQSTRQHIGQSPSQAVMCVAQVRVAARAAHAAPATTVCAASTLAGGSAAQLAHQRQRSTS